MNLVPARDVKRGHWSPEVEQMKFLTTAAWAVLIGVLLNACASLTFDPDNKPPYGQANGRKSDR